jgi:hypothetical protein
MTMVEARAILAPLGLVIRKRDGEYRVAFRLPPRTHGQPRAFDQEASAYYTTDLDDAVGTGIAMAKAGPQHRLQSSAKE